MRKIIYRKSDLRCVGTIQHNTTFEWELEHNVIANFGGLAEDYDFVETQLEGAIHVENNDGVILVLENEPTSEEIKNGILKNLKELDNPRDAESIFEALKSKGILIDADLPIQTKNRFDVKKQLRQQLQALEV